MGRSNWHSLRRPILGLAAILAVFVSASVIRDSRAADWSFRARFSEDVHAEPFTGRVYLFFSRRHEEPRLGPDWFRPEPFVSTDVTGWKPGETLTFSSAEPGRSLAFPKPLADLDLAGARVQPVARFNPYDRNVGTGAGNGYGPAVVVPASGEALPPLEINRLVPEPSFEETERIRLLDVRSPLLIAFHGRDVHLNGAVILPSSYEREPNRRYPTIFIIPGFGGTHYDVRDYLDYFGERGAVAGDVEFLQVLLDPSCPLGHHTFTDSANNGPVGEALIKELIPAFDQQYRSIPEAGARFLTGHSSAGWSSLWLQITYPDFFAGTWSTAPDPVDFRDFQQINLYRPGENMYVDSEGEPRPLARRNGHVMIWYRDFARMEWTLGYGGQLHSFEAVFSPLGPDGRPRPLWDRATGAVDPDVARAWETYDIRAILERDWPTLSPKLAGKLHIFMGDEDTFYLEGATKLLKDSLARLGSDAVVEIHPGKDHSTLMTHELRRRIIEEMGQSFTDSRPARIDR